MDTKTAEDCGKLSEEEKITFPEVVARLDRAGIESYTANLLVANKIYYAGNEAYTMPMKINSERKVAEEFNSRHIGEAITAIQAKQIGYQEFLHRIMEAGVICYCVFIRGKKAVYFGRRGEQHIEPFPGQ